MDDIKTKLGERLALIRGRRNQKEFGESIGISRGAVSYYENARRTLDVEILDRICEKYDISADWLMGYTDVLERDITLRKICEITKLSEGAIKRLSNREGLSLPFYGKSYLAGEYRDGNPDYDSYPNILNFILQSDVFYQLIDIIAHYIYSNDEQSSIEWNEGRPKIIEKSKNENYTSIYPSDIYRLQADLAFNSLLEELKNSHTHDRMIQEINEKIMRDYGINAEELEENNGEHTED